MRMALAIFLAMPSENILVLVTNKSSPTNCTLLPSFLREYRPAVPVALAHAVLDGDDRILGDEARQIIGELGWS
jgi:hypothetical protein